MNLHFERAEFLLQKMLNNKQAWKLVLRDGRIIIVDVVPPGSEILAEIPERESNVCDSSFCIG